jgi:hypothetical protein
LGQVRRTGAAGVLVWRGAVAGVYPQVPPQQCRGHSPCRGQVPAWKQRLHRKHVLAVRCRNKGNSARRMGTIAASFWFCFGHRRRP